MKKYTVYHDGMELADPENYRKSGLSVEDIHDLLDSRSFREPHSGELYDTLDAAKAEFDAAPVSTDVFPKGQSPYRNGHIEISVVFLMREEYDENGELESADELGFRAEPILPDESEEEQTMRLSEQEILEQSGNHSWADVFGDYAPTQGDINTYCHEFVSRLPADFASLDYDEQRAAASDAAEEAWRAVCEFEDDEEEDEGDDEEETE